jgi:hypothetical protein
MAILNFLPIADTPDPPFDQDPPVGPSDPVTPTPDPLGDSSTLEELQIEESALLAIAYGQHVVSGNLVRFEKTDGPPPGIKFINALGEGVWQGPLNGDDVYYGGERIPPATNSTSVGFKFHPGTLSTGPSDSEQGTPLYFPSDPPYSGTAYVEVFFDDPEQRVDKFRGVFQCKVIADYDSDGDETDPGSYSTNPARVAADILKRSGKLNLVDWPSWTAWRDYCDDLISYAGTSIKRFESHHFILQNTTISEALNQITLSTCSFWQDSGDKIVFKLPIEANSDGYDSVYDFDDSNCQNLTIFSQDQGSFPTGYKATFRDLNDPFMAEVSVEWVDFDLEQSFGKNRVNIQLPPMQKSQAERICSYLLKLEGNRPGLEFVSFGGSCAVLPGDIVKITHPLIPYELDDVPNTTYLLVTNTSDLPEEEGPSIRRVRGKRLTIDGFYSDLNHTDPPTAIPPSP